MLGVRLPSLGAMFNLNLTPGDRKWLVQKYPSLKIRDDSDVTILFGTLKINMVYEDKGGNFVIFPKKYDGSGVCIKDEYEVKILFQKSNITELPQVFETGSKIKNLARGKGLPLSDLHVNGDGSVCLCVAGKEKEYFPDGFKTQVFFNQLLIPFFYAQTYFRKYGNWPWGEYGHGILGIFEAYYEKQNTDRLAAEEMLRTLKLSSDWNLISAKFKRRDQIKGHMICPCGKNMKIRKCHPQALAGMWKFKNDLAKFNLKTKI